MQGDWLFGEHIASEAVLTTAYDLSSHRRKDSRQISTQS